MPIVNSIIYCLLSIVVLILYFTFVLKQEQYALVYKAVVQLVEEELEKDKFKFHTYVNVQLPRSPQSPTGHYENCDFIKSVDRWKQSDMQNGSVPRRPLSLPLVEPEETKTDPKPLASKRGAIAPPSPEGMIAKPVPAERKSDPKPFSSNRAPLPTPSPEGMVVSSERKGSKDYVNLEFAKSIEAVKKLSPTESKPAISTKPTVPYKDAVKRGAQSPTGGQVKSPIFPDYEVLPGPSPSPPMLNTANNTAVQRNKGSVSDYEFPSSAAQGGKKQITHVPEGMVGYRGSSSSRFIPSLRELQFCSQ